MNNKIVLFVARYSLTGVPQAQIRLAEALYRRGNDVDFVFGFIPNDLKAPVIKGVNIINFNQHRVVNLCPSIISYIKNNKPNIIFSAEDHLNIVVLIAAIVSRSKAKISCSSRVTPYDTYSRKPFTKRWALKYLMRIVMWRADALTCVSQGTVEEYRKVFNSPRHVCVYNIVDEKYLQLKMQEPVVHEWYLAKDRPLLVAAGSLGAWKGYADLIHAMKLLSQRKSVRLLIFGDGPLRVELEALIIKLDLSNVVRLMGQVENPLKYFANSDVFAHSALTESFGNVLVEAMACGCTPVSTNCPTGPREILQDGRFGFLVPMRDPEAMANALQMAIENPMSLAELKVAIEPFTEERIIQKHFNVLGV